MTYISQMKIILIILFFSFANSSNAVEAKNFELPSVFGSHMVLQQKRAVPIWGWVTPGQEITVTFAGQSKTAKADATGKWLIKLDPLKASAVGRDLVIEHGEKITLTDVLVGEVWLCGGQSNMEWSLKLSHDPQKEIAQANYPNIRKLGYQHIAKSTRQRNAPGKWQICSPKTAAGFSGVAYYFAKYLQAELNVPIGLLEMNWGGTNIETWIPIEGFRSVKELDGIAKKLEADDSKTTLGKANHRKALAEIKKWCAACEKALAEGKDLPGQPKNIFNGKRPSESQRYNGMINPIAGYAMQGAIWYQGESNMGDKLYDKKMEALINGWRQVWHQGDFPFYYVQLAPFSRKAEALGRIWECQSNALAIKNTGMAVLTDIGNLKNIHPTNKFDVGKRLALWALAKNYGQKKLVYSGPKYKSMKVDGNKIILSFDYVHKGLESDDAKALRDFTICGKDKKFVTAKAKIVGDTVVVSSESVKDPIAVRLGWDKDAEPNLANKNKLPASPFRTDDF